MRNNRKKTPITAIADIEKFSHDGRGIARIDGKTTFIANALPGERVSFNYTRTKKDYDEGVAQEIIIPSINRAEPKCAHYESCGGCSLQHLSAELQIKEKQDLLLDLLQRIGHCNPDEILPALRAESWHYRNKARLSVRYVTKKKGSLIGFREKINPRYITEIDECPILHRKVGLKFIELRSLIDSLTHPSAIAQIEVAAGDYEVALIFRNLHELTSADQEKLVAFAQENELIIFLQPGNAESVYRIYPQASDDYIHYSLPDENLQFKFHPTDFTQVNAGLNQLMIKQALELLQLNADDVVLDLFCGLGNFSLPIAKKSKQVIGIEGSSAMVDRATMNAKLNNIDNVIFYAADLDKPNELQNFQLPAISKMLIDPPRSGALEIVKQIKYLKPSSLVYVSCNPATLARDCDVLVNQLGYRLKAAGVMDMFPHTAHVESIALFEKDS